MILFCRWVLLCRTEDSLGHSEKLQEIATSVYRDQLQKIATANTHQQTKKETVFIKSKQDARDEEQAISDLTNAANERAFELQDQEENLILDDDDDDPELAVIKAKRMMEIQRQYEITQEKKQKGHGEYLEITQDEFLKQVTKSKYVICSFYHADFERCKVIDKHIAKLSQTHFETKFIKIDAAKCVCSLSAFCL